MQAGVATWVDALWPWLQRDLPDPVHVRASAKDWRIELLGCIRISLARDHLQFRARRRARRASGNCRWIRSCTRWRNAWRLLCREGRSLWRPLERCHEFERYPNATVAAWMGGGNAAPAVPRGAGWTWFAAQAGISRRQRIEQAIPERSPGEPYRDFDFEGMRFTRLNSQASLFREGLHFRNCLVRIADAHPHTLGTLPDGDYYRLSEAARGRRLALLRTTRWRTGKPCPVIQERRAACNRPVPLALHEEAQHFLEALPAWMAAASPGKGSSRRNGSLIQQADVTKPV